MMDKELKPLYAELKGYLEHLPKEPGLDELIEDEQVWKQYNAAVEKLCRITGNDYSGFSVELAKMYGHVLPAVRVSTYKQKLGGLISRLEAEYFSSSQHIGETMKAGLEKNNNLSLIEHRKVFVIHGRNNRLRNDFFNFLRAIKLDPIEWSEALKFTGTGTPYIGEILDCAFSKSQAIIALLTPDDEVKLKGEFIDEDDPLEEKEVSGQARPNVLFEAGMALGKNPLKTILVTVGKIKPFSDVAGRHIIRLDNSGVKRQEIADRLKTAGCAVSLDGRDWHTVGNFVV